jgi:acetyl esterase/lipase
MQTLWQDLRYGARILLKQPGFTMKLKAIAVIGLLLALAAAAAAQTTQTTRAELPAPDNFLGIATFPLWEGDAPGALGKALADIPTLTIFRPHRGTANGTAVIVAPGGAYLGLAANLEGRQVADWFAARGVTAFVLKYRLGRNYLYPTPLLDAQRAIRLVRARAKEFGVASDRVGIMGFSAGGHLTATAATMFDGGRAEASDGVERASSRPDFIILGYPWLNAMKPDQKGVLSYCSALKIEPEKCKGFEQYSPDSRVSAQTPPAFIYHTTDDELVPVEASVTFYQALRKAGVSAEMHLFAKGKHGSGLGLGDAALDLWPSLLEAWLRGRGLLTPDPAPAPPK